jgi:hypothetical protein
MIKLIISEFMSLHPSRIGESNILHLKHCVRQHTYRTLNPNDKVIVLSQDDKYYYVINKDLLLSLLILCLL